MAEVEVYFEKENGRLLKTGPIHLHMLTEHLALQRNS